MNSLLNVPVSKFENYFNPEPSETNLWEWLTDRSEEELIKKLRSVNDKKQRDELKAKLSCVTISGRFGNPRGLETIVDRSGLMCIDVDPKENPNIENYHEFKAIVSKASFVAYAGLSASGKGYFVIIPIEYPDKHIQHFIALEAMFLEIGVVIDKSCKDVSRLRGRSFDPDPYINHNAKKFKALLEPPKPKTRTTNFQYRHLQGDTAQSWVERYIKELQSRRVDITGTYQEWLKIGFAISHEFGEGGRDYFHDISNISDDYNPTECDKQYDRCVKGRGDGVKIGTFFHACQAVGIDLNQTMGSRIVIPPSPIESSRPENQPINGSTELHNADNLIVNNRYDIRSNKVEPSQIIPECDECDSFKKKPVRENEFLPSKVKTPEVLEAFDIAEHLRWMKTLQPLAKGESIRLSSSEYPVCNLRFFITGRLEAIEAWNNSRRGPGEKALFIRQINDLRIKLENRKQRML
jgi:hypothetical protein